MSDEELAASQQPAQREQRNRPSSASAERASRETAWHLKKPALALETPPPPRKRCLQEDYRRPELAIEPASAFELDVPGIATKHPAVISEVLTPLDDIPIPIRPLSERLVCSIDDGV